MSIYEVIGLAFVVYMACVGVYIHARLVIHGIHRVAGRMDIGSEYEDAAVREYLGDRRIAK